MCVTAHSAPLAALMLHIFDNRIERLSNYPITFFKVIMSNFSFVLDDGS